MHCRVTESLKFFEIKQKKKDEKRKKIQTVVFHGRKITNVEFANEGKNRDIGCIK